MQKTHILVVEDEEEIAQLVSYNLLKNGFHVSCAGSGEEGLELLQAGGIDCVLLDLMLPGMDGMEVCRLIKGGTKGAAVPVIMLTARGEDDDIVDGLECGADDYIPKPFSPKVLIARIKAVLRRDQQQAGSTDGNGEGKIVLDSLTIDRGHHEVSLDGEQLQLTTTEFDILVLLAGRPGWVFSRQQIIDSVRGYDFLVTSRAVDVQIFGLRKKLGTAGQKIVTVRGIGYKFGRD